MIEEAELLQARILIVDDQESNVKLLRQLLLHIGYVDISSTMEVLKVCQLHQEFHYDLILLDLQMANMGGFAVLEALRTQLPKDFPSVIVITAQSGHKLRALQGGARDYMGKPFELTELRTRVRNVLEMSQLYKRLEHSTQELEARVAERTAELRESEARFRSLTELASDWYWEQDDNGKLTKLSGPVPDMLGIHVESAELQSAGDQEISGGWEPTQHAELKARIAAREPFLDFVLCRHHGDGVSQRFLVSGEPVFNRLSMFVGYRGVGVEVSESE